jgi:uncharacterized integral membrane protein (TIGR00698 family)
MFGFAVTADSACETAGCPIELSSAVSVDSEKGPESSGLDDPTPQSPNPKRPSDDWLAILCAALLLVVSFVGVVTSSSSQPVSEVAADAEVNAEVQTKFVAVNPFANLIGLPEKWTKSPIEAFAKNDADGSIDLSALIKSFSVFAILATLLTVAISLREGSRGSLRFFVGFIAVSLLALLSYTLAQQSFIKSTNLEYVLWAIMVGLIISNTIGTPGWIRPAMLTEFFIKTGLVLLGAEVLMSKLMALGLPGIFTSWVVTPVVLIGTYIFGQKVLKIESRSLNMVISADMSVCGVSAAIASAAACKAKKEELSLAIGISLIFTVIMMVVMPWFIRFVGMDETVGGAWIGGTIDSTGAVAAAGLALGERGLEVAALVKMIQNVLIGVFSFGIATYWVTCVEKDPQGKRPEISEIWKRFPRFVLGFIGVSIIFSLIDGRMENGSALVDSVIKGSTKTLREWLFCLAFVSIGLETNFRQLAPYLKGGKPLILYVCGQALNLTLTLLMAYLMFGVLFRDIAKS